MCSLLSGLNIRCREMSRRTTVAVRTYRRVSEALKSKATVYGGLFLYGQRRASFCLLLVPKSGSFGAGGLSTRVNSTELSFTGPRCVRGCLSVAPKSIDIVKLVGSARKGMRLLVSRSMVGSPCFNYRPYVGASDLGVHASSLVTGVVPTLGRTPGVIGLPKTRGRRWLLVSAESVSY